MSVNVFGSVWQRLVFSQVRFGLLLVRSTISQLMPLGKVDSIYKIESNRILLWRQSVCDFGFRHEVAGVRYRDYSLPLCIHPILKIIQK